MKIRALPPPASGRGSACSGLGRRAALRKDAVPVLRGVWHPRRRVPPFPCLARNSGAAYVPPTLVRIPETEKQLAAG